MVVRQGPTTMSFFLRRHPSGVFLLHLGFSRETSDPMWDWARATLMRVLPHGASSWIIRRMEGPVERVGGEGNMPERQ
jgi:hypothetical protein